jgi:hypothetical protein
VRLRLETSSDELALRGAELVEAVTDQLELEGVDVPSALADAGAPEAVDILGFPVMRHLYERMQRAYAEALQRLGREAEQILVERKLPKARAAHQQR